MALILTPHTQQLTVRREGVRVVLLLNGRRIADLPWAKAEELARALISQARRCEEQEQADAIIADQAILTRIGFGIGLSNNPDILAAAANEAAWGAPRRYIPLSRAHGIASQAIFGTPAIRLGRPRKANRHG